MKPDAWPALPLDAWQDTYATVHLWTQMLGKTRLALEPPQNHWWHTTLYVSARGLTTSAMPYREGTVDIELDFLSDALVIRTSEGETASLPLAARPVADHYREYVRLLESVGVNAAIWPMPVEIAGAVPFAADHGHASYDGDAMRRCWRILQQTEHVLAAFRSDFLGKCSPAHFWWGAFDLASTRFSSRTAPEHPGGVPNLADHVTREAYSHECYSAGWWPGTVGAPVQEPAFYAYAYPEPPGFATATVQPDTAFYHAELREWVLPYDAVRTAADPAAYLRQFLQSTYAAAADLGRWDRAALERSVGHR